MNLECCIASQNKTIANKWMDFKCKESHMRKSKFLKGTGCGGKNMGQNSFNKKRKRGRI